MSLTPEQLRSAFGTLDGTRDVRVVFEHAEACTVRTALLVPAEGDGLIKLTDGVREYGIDAKRVVWIAIGDAGPRL